MDNGVPDDEAWPLAPSIPSFASLRGGRRRSAADLLVPRRPATVQPVPSSPRPGVARPAEWADLWHISLRFARWFAEQRIATIRRLIS
jgi:hypothetical protein